VAPVAFNKRIEMNAPGLSHRRCRGYFHIWALTVAVLSGPGAAVLHAEGSEPRVELECKIVSSSPQARYHAWVVEIRKADGEPLRQMLKGTGDTVHVKDLQPGIYTLCLIGRQDREHCESIDLTPPANRMFFKFKKRLKTPEPAVNRQWTHRVSVSNLSIPKAARAEVRRSEEAELRGDVGETLRLLEHALAIFSDYPAALNNLGVQYYRSGDYTRSMQYLLRATAIDPDFFAAWANLGSSLLAVAKFEEALPVNMRALALKPDDPRVVCQLGLNYYYLRSYSDAKQYFEKAVLLDPLAASSPQLFLAQIAIIQKREAEAERYIGEYLRLHPNTPQAAQLKDVLAGVRARHFVSLPSKDLPAGP